jgi:hypothetical protein
VQASNSSIVVLNSLIPHLIWSSRVLNVSQHTVNKCIYQRGGRRKIDCFPWVTFRGQNVPIYKHCTSDWHWNYLNGNWSLPLLTTPLPDGCFRLPWACHSPTLIHNCEVVRKSKRESHGNSLGSSTGMKVAASNGIITRVNSEFSKLRSGFEWWIEILNKFEGLLWLFRACSACWVWCDWAFNGHCNEDSPRGLPVWVVTERSATQQEYQSVRIGSLSDIRSTSEWNTDGQLSGTGKG